MSENANVPCKGIESSHHVQSGHYPTLHLDQVAGRDEQTPSASQEAHTTKEPFHHRKHQYNGDNKQSGGKSQLKFESKNGCTEHLDMLKEKPEMHRATNSNMQTGECQ